MDGILLAMFAEGRGAREAARALGDLDTAGCIDLFATSLIAMGVAGDAAIIVAPDEGPLGAAVRLFTGRIHAAVGGPPCQPGSLGCDEGLVNDVTARLRPGGSVLVAELWEQWVHPVNAQLSMRGAVLVRRGRADTPAAEIERLRALLEAERAVLERERERTARDDYDGALERRITVVRDKIRAVRARAGAALDAARAEHDAKMAVVFAKLAVARGPLRAGLDARISERLAENRQRTMALLRTAI